MKIEEAIKQNQFKNEFLKAHINISFTAKWLESIVNNQLKPYQVSLQQYNILRILRGMSPNPATVKLLMTRMIDKMSNASRLVDKLEKKQFVKRTVCEKDRRQVSIFITSQGIDFLAKISEQLEGSVIEKVNRLSPEEAKLLNQLLDKIRTED